MGNPWLERAGLNLWCRLEECAGIHRHPFICVFNSEPTFTVRGLCKEANMDTQYKFEDHRPGPYGWHPLDYRSFVGPKGWIISRNLTDKKWRMTHYYYTTLTLTMMTKDALPVGKHKWLVENDVCNEGETSSQILQLSGCKEGQFTCDDGKCLDISQRCNSIEVLFCYLHCRS